MKCIVGLGNPGKAYEATRHNVGWMAVDALRDSLPNAPSFSAQAKFSALLLEQKDLLLVKPQTYMNLSGRAVASIVNYFKLNPKTELLVVHDDLDIALGKFKIQFGKGPRLHGGVDSIESVLKTDQFWRVRIGVEGLDRQDKSKTEKIPGKNYVLQSFSSEEQSVVHEVIVQANSALIKQIQS
jgi:PTH1 family peptidyl-tRNA hydrolase